MKTTMMRFLPKPIRRLAGRIGDAWWEWRFKRAHEPMSVIVGSSAIIRGAKNDPIACPIAIAFSDELGVPCAVQRNDDDRTVFLSPGESFRAFLLRDAVGPHALYDRLMRYDQTGQMNPHNVTADLFPKNFDPKAIYYEPRLQTLSGDGRRLFRGQHPDFREDA